MIRVMAIYIQASSLVGSTSWSLTSRRQVKSQVKVRWRRLCRDRGGLPQSSEAFIKLAASLRMLSLLGSVSEGNLALNYPNFARSSGSMLPSRLTRIAVV